MGRPSKYPPEFQREAIDLVLSSGRTIKQVADSLGMTDGTLSNWVRAARDAKARAEDPDGLSESERTELARCGRRTSSCAPTRRSCGRLLRFSPARRCVDRLPLRPRPPRRSRRDPPVPPGRSVPLHLLHLGCRPHPGGGDPTGVRR